MEKQSDLQTSTVFVKQQVLRSTILPTFTSFVTLLLSAQACFVGYNTVFPISWVSGQTICAQRK
jgi:hypothetical protein